MSSQGSSTDGKLAASSNLNLLKPESDESINNERSDNGGINAAAKKRQLTIQIAVPDTQTVNANKLHQGQGLKSSAPKSAAARSRSPSPHRSQPEFSEPLERTLMSPLNPMLGASFGNVVMSPVEAQGRFQSPLSGYPKSARCIDNLKSPTFALPPKSAYAESERSAYPMSPMTPSTIASAENEADAEALPSYQLSNLSKADKSNAQSVIWRFLTYASWFDRLLMVLAIIATIAFGASTNSIPYLYGFIYDTFEQFKNGFIDKATFADRTSFYSLLFVILGLSIMVLSSLSHYLWSWTGCRQYNHIIKKYYAAVLAQDIAQFDRETEQSENGYFDTLTESNFARLLFSDYIAKLLCGLASALVAIALGFVINARLAAVFFASIPILIITATLIKRIVHRNSAKQQSVRAASVQFVVEVMSAIKVVLMYNGSDNELKVFTKLSEDRRLAAYNVYFAWATYLGIIYVLMFTSYGLSYWYGGVLVAGKEASGGNVIQMFLLVLATFFNFTMISNKVVEIVQGLDVIEKLLAVIEADSILQQYDESRTQQQSKYDGEIVLSSVKFSYAARSAQPVYTNLNMVIPAKKVTAIVSPSGGGKSTITSLLQRFYELQGGSIMIGGIDIAHADLKHLRSQFAVVSQEPFLFSMTVRDNLCLNSEPQTSAVTQSELIQVCEVAQCYEFIKALPKGFDTLLGEGGSKLSGGQAQRLVIARALLRKHTKYLILDEATSYLDQVLEQKLYDSLLPYCKNLTVIIIAHRLSSIKNADKICYMESGAVIEEGSFEQLMKNGGPFSRLTLQMLPKPLTIDLQRKKSVDVKSFKSYGTGRVSLAASMKTMMSTTNWQCLKLLQYAKYDKYLLWVLGIVALLSGTTNPLYSFIFARVMSTYTNNDAASIQSGALIIAYSYLAYAVFKGVVSFAMYSLGGSVSTQLSNSLRQATFRSILIKDVSWFEKTGNAPGILSTRLNDDPVTVHKLFFNVYPQALDALATAIGGLILALYAGWKLALLTMACFPVIGLAVYGESLILGRMESSIISVQENAEELLRESIDGIRTVTSYNLQTLFAQRFDRILAQSYKNLHIKNLVKSLGKGLFDVVTHLCEAVVIYAGSKFLLDGTYTLDEVLLVFSSIIYCASSLQSVGDIPGNLASINVSSKNLLSIVAQKQHAIDIVIPNMVQAIKPEIKGRIEFSNVKFAYPAHPHVLVIDNLSLKIKAGSKMAIVGQSGCGKSTLFQLLLRFYKIGGGSIYVDEHNIRKMNLEHLREHIAVVPQQPTLFNRTIRENILYGLNNDTSSEKISVEIACHMAQIDKFIESLPLKYDTLVGDKGIQVSGGERLRICIARALVRSPKILLLDEYTSSLDAKTEFEVNSTVFGLQNMTIVMIAHRLSTVKDADRIAVMSHGQVVEQGTHDELLQLNGHYFTMVNSNV